MARDRRLNRLERSAPRAPWWAEYILRRRTLWNAWFESCFEMPKDGDDELAESQSKTASALADEITRLRREVVGQLRHGMREMEIVAAIERDDPGGYLIYMPWLLRFIGYDEEVDAAEGKKEKQRV